MRTLACLATALLGAIVPLVAQSPSKTPYKIDFDPKRDVDLQDKAIAGSDQTRLWVNVRFSISVEGTANDPPGTVYKVIIEENGKEAKVLDVPQPTPNDDLSAVLAIDTSGSMREHNRMVQARDAAKVFLNKLPAKADCGLILFDHEMRESLAPGADRQKVRALIDAVQPRGGTAYIDAAYEGVQMLAKLPSTKEKALVVVTDGFDLNSTKTVEAVIDQAKKNRIRVYTIGIGEPGKLETVSTALVLDRSGSMIPPADDNDKTPKIKAMHQAASRFVSIIPSTGRVSLIPFSSAVDTPKAFSNEKFLLINAIKKLEPEGETALFDGICTAIATLEADGAKGRRVVVAMTDGVDNSSRHRVEEVIERAKEAKISLYLLGFGRDHEIDEATMKQMASATGGKYYHARNEKSLIEIFENLSADIHDSGIDEPTLTRLAEKTGGQYYPAKDVGQLRLILEQVTKSIQRKSYEETFESFFQRRDGTQRNITIKLVRGTGELVSNTAGGSYQVVEEKKGAYQVTGVVVAEMNHLVYLMLLAIVGALIAIPAWLQRPAGHSRA